MAACNDCGDRLVPTESCFPGFDLLACQGCGRPVKLLIKNARRLGGGTHKKADLNRALRASRRRRIA